MSLMRINHTSNEIRRIEVVICNLISNYDRDFKEYDSKSLDVENYFLERGEIAQKSEGWDVLYEISKEEVAYDRPLEDFRSFSQFQNELILVKHVALIENMIVSIFRCLVHLLQNVKYMKKYFVDVENFSDSFVAVNKISELTNKKIDLKKSKFWSLYETMKTIRNTIAHGDPLFVISYRRAKKFNNEIGMISMCSERNECELTKGMYPSLLHPTYKNASTWYCCLTSDLHALPKLNSRCLQFVEETKNLYLAYGKENGISKHELYGCKPYGKAH